jgi:hypothetical protein
MFYQAAFLRVAADFVCREDKRRISAGKRDF